MIWIASGICLLNAYVHYRANGHRMMNIGFIMSAWWGVILCINALTPYDWYPLDEKTGILLLVTSVSIVLGTASRNSVYIGELLRGKGRGETAIVCDAQKEKIGSLFWAVQGFLILLLLPMTFRAVRLLSRNGFNMYYLRIAYANGASNDAFMSTFERMFYIHYIVGPFCSAFTIIDILLCFSNRFWKKPFVFAVTMTLLRTMYTGGRTLFFMLLLVLGGVLSLYRSCTSSNTFRHIKAKLRKPALIIIILLCAITVSRNNSASNPLSNVVRTLVEYFGAGVRVLNSIVQYPQLYGLEKYSFGAVTFAGLLSDLRTVDLYSLSRVGMGIFPKGVDFYSLSQGMVASNIQYGQQSAMNAFPTMIYYFLRDGGVLTVILFTVTFLQICSKIERNYFAERSLFRAFIYILMIYIIIMSVCWWEPVNGEFWMELLWGYIICRVLVRKNIAFKKRNVA